MNSTINYGLKKPLGTEFYSLANVNDNWDTIDSELKAIDTKFGSKVFNTNNNIILTSENSIVFADATNNNITITLPTAIGNEYQYIIKKIDSSINTLTINTINGELLEGNTNYVFEEHFKAVTIVSNGTKWFIINQVALTGYGY